MGGVLLWVMAAGFLTVTIWQLMEAVLGRDDPLREGGVKGRGRSAGRAAIYLALGLLAIGVSIGAASGLSKARRRCLQNSCRCPSASFSLV